MACEMIDVAFTCDPPSWDRMLPHALMLAATVMTLPDPPEPLGPDAGALPFCVPPLEDVLHPPAANATTTAAEATQRLFTTTTPREDERHGLSASLSTTA